MDTVGDYQLMQKLGDGFSGTVRVGRHKKTNQMVAMKIASSDVIARHPEISELMAKEFEILSVFDHPHIIRAIEFQRHQNFRSSSRDVKYSVPFLVLELADKGELCELIVETGPFPDQVARYYFWQLLNAVDHVHRKGVAHRDIKLENLLLNKNMDLKLIDFAFSTRSSQFDSSPAGTEGYIPPETFTDSKFDVVSQDMFAIGVTLFIMVRGSPPFNSASAEDPFYRVLTKNPSAFWDYQKSIDPSFEVSTSFKQLIEGLLAKDPKNRWGVRDILKNEWYNRSVDERAVLEYINNASRKLLEVKNSKSFKF